MDSRGHYAVWIRAVHLLQPHGRGQLMSHEREGGAAAAVCSGGSQLHTGPDHRYGATVCRARFCALRSPKKKKTQKNNRKTTRITFKKACSENLSVTQSNTYKCNSMHACITQFLVLASHMFHTYKSVVGHMYHA